MVIAGDGVNLPQAVELLKERGAKEIVVITRKAALENADAVTSAGAKIMANAAVTRLEGEEDALIRVEATDLATRETCLVDAKTLFIASGRFPELVFTPVVAEEEEIIDLNAPLAWEAVEFFKKIETESEMGLLSAQNMVSEYPSAVTAINGGRKAAVAIHNRMYGIEYQDNTNVITEKSCVQDVTRLEDVAVSARQIMDVASSPDELKDSFSTGLSVEAAQQEADRCLRCGLVCYEKKGAAPIS